VRTRRKSASTASRNSPKFLPSFADQVPTLRRKSIGPPRRTRLVVNGEMPFQALAHDRPTGRHGIDSQDRKLLVSQARHDVAAATTAGKNLGHVAERVIPRARAETLGQCLQVFEQRADQQQRPARAAMRFFMTPRASRV